MQGVSKVQQRTKKPTSPSKQQKKEEQQQKLAEPEKVLKSARGNVKGDKQTQKQEVHQPPTFSKIENSNVNKKEKSKSIDQSLSHKKQVIQEAADQNQEISQPKRPPSSFMIFSNEKRKKLMEQNPEMKLTQISKLLGNLWNELMPPEKRIYEDKAQQCKDHYIKEKEFYDERQNEKVMNEEEKRLKKPPSSFMIFSSQNDKEYRQKFPDLKTPQIAAQKGQDWKALTEGERKFYENLAQEKKQSYLLQVQKQAQEQEVQKVEEASQKKQKVESAKKQKVSPKVQRKESPEKVQTALKTQKQVKVASQLSQSTNTSSMKGKGK